MNQNNSLSVIGIDVAKATLDICLLPQGQSWKIENTREALQAWAQTLETLPALCVLEATGGYERCAVGVLQALGWALAVVNPLQARHFARACGRLSKTDKIDARMLAQMGQALDLRRIAPADAVRAELNALATRRQQYLTMKTMENNRLGQTTLERVRETLQKHVAWIERELDELEAEMSKLIADSPQLQAQFELMKQVKGIGDQTARTLLIHLAELGHANRRQLAALAGLAPTARDSGTKQGKRYIQGGRAVVRTALYQAALSASQHNPAVHAMAMRLRAKHKPPKQILIACAHKLLRILSALVKQQADWNPHFEQVAA